MSIWAKAIHISTHLLLSLCIPALGDYQRLAWILAGFFDHKLLGVVKVLYKPFFTSQVPLQHTNEVTRYHPAFRIPRFNGLFYKAKRILSKGQFLYAV